MSEQCGDRRVADARARSRRRFGPRARPATRMLESVQAVQHALRVVVDTEADAVRRRRPRRASVERGEQRLTARDEVLLEVVLEEVEAERRRRGGCTPSPRRTRRRAPAPCSTTTQSPCQRPNSSSASPTSASSRSRASARPGACLRARARPRRPCVATTSMPRTVERVSGPSSCGNLVQREHRRQQRPRDALGPARQRCRHAELEPAPRPACNSAGAWKRRGAAAATSRSASDSARTCAFVTSSQPILAYATGVPSGRNSWSTGV